MAKKNNDATGMFDWGEGRRRRDEGMDRALRWKLFRAFLASRAVHYAAVQRKVYDQEWDRQPFEATSDDIYRICKELYGSKNGAPPNMFDEPGWLGKASGSVWGRDGKKWSSNGMTQSRRTNQQGTKITVWVLHPDYRVAVTMPPREEVIAELAAEDGIGGTAAVGS
jgi:hypothetical protein